MAMTAYVLTDEQIEKIHQASCSILDRIGVIIPHDEMLSRFADCGARVDLNNRRVHIPHELVESLLAKAGRRFTLYGRDTSRTAEFGVGKRNYNSIAGEALWIDNIGDKRRYATLPDVVAATRMGDALSSITMPGAMSDPHELPAEWRCVAVAAEMIKNTTKPITFWLHDRRSAEYLVELVIALRGDQDKAREQPLFYPLLEPISPLSFAFNGIDLLYETARLAMPVTIGPMAQMGVSAPATLAGTMAQENAEILAGICVTQLVREGTPVCYGGICHAFDMATTQMIFSGPEQAIFGVAMTQMGKRYGLPVYINVGLTDAKRPDAQAGIEAGITLALGAAAGADIFGHMGISGVDQAASLDMLILQDEIISYVESVSRPIEISDDTLGIDVMEETGPKGTFMDKLHTVEHFRKEIWLPKLMDRSFYDAWRDTGARSMEERCRARKEELLRLHEVEPLDENMAGEIDRIVEAARQHLQR
ncbi:MAG: trimethylamine methyltransferase family protein [Candidatus Latescibacterota bacterium]